MAFSELIGQQNIKSRLINMAKNKSSQSLLLAGPVGIGKKSFAREYSKAVLCRNPNDNGACGTCDCCKYFDAGTLPDYIVADSTNKTIKVEDLKTQVVASVANLPQISESKVYVIDLNKLNESGQNAILKSVEEPPHNVFFVLLTTDVAVVLPTILSRTTQIKMPLYSVNEVLEIERMADGSREDLKFCAEFSSGIPGRALTLLLDDTFEKLREDVINMVTKMPDMSYTDVFTNAYAVFSGNSDKTDDILLLLMMLFEDLSILLKAPQATIKNEDKRAELLKFIESHQYLTMIKLGEANSAIVQFIEEQKLHINFESSCSSMLLKIHKELKR